MTKYRYFQFPLIFLRNIHEDFNSWMQDIVNYATVDFALKQDIDLNDATRELLYSYYRDQENSYKPAMQALDSLFKEGVIECNEDYLIFNGSGQVNDSIVCDAAEVISKDHQLRDLAILNKQLRNIDSFFSVKGLTCSFRYEHYKTLNKYIVQHENKYGKEPRPTIRTDLFWDLYNNDKDPVLFSAYMAIRSVEGQNRYAATNRPTIAGRMAGAKSPSVLESFIGEELKVFEKFNHRYHFTKLLERLHKRGLIKSILRQKNWRHIYISTRLSPEELGEAVASQAEKRNLNNSNNIALESYSRKRNQGTTSL